MKKRKDFIFGEGGESKNEINKTELLTCICVMRHSHRAYPWDPLKR